MVSVIILDKNEPKVTQYTFEQLYKELKDINGSELLIKQDWDIQGIKNRFVCFVEADCLVSPHFFQDQLNILRNASPRVAVLAPTTAVHFWNNKIYGYTLDSLYDRIMPNRKPKTSNPYQIQIAYLPGSFIRLSTLKKFPVTANEDPVILSAKTSLDIWEAGLSIDEKHPEGQLGRQIQLNPVVTYCTTNRRANDIQEYNEPISTALFNLFVKESI